MGIRVSELRFVTAEAVKKGEALVKLKGKIRTVFIPPELARMLKKYMIWEEPLIKVLLILTALMLLILSVVLIIRFTLFI